MGYTTDFEGEFKINPPLEAAQVAYLAKFCETRRMRRDPVKAQERPDRLREAVGLPIGVEAGYCVSGTGSFGQGHDEDVLSYNAPPSGQPGLWCHWVASEDGSELAWDGGEKFYSYVEWLDYIVAHFLTPWGRTLSGSVEWRGEDPTDLGRIECSAVDGMTQVRALPGRVVYG